MSNPFFERKQRERDSIRGRNTLSGLDQTLGRVAFDHMMEREANGALSNYKLSWTGIPYPPHPLTAHGIRFQMRLMNGVNKLGSRIIHPNRKHADSHTTWVRLMYESNSKWISDMFMTHIPYHWIMVPYRTRARTICNTRPVFSLNHVMAWLEFLWPNPDDLWPRAIKYLMGVTPGYINKFPGVGERVRCTTTRMGDAVFTGTISGWPDDAACPRVRVELDNAIDHLTPNDWSVIGIDNTPEF